MALLRACNIPCRVHGFTIDKSLQKGAMTGFVYRNAPKSIFHSWVEINFENQDFGVYDCPDELLKEHHQEISAFKAFAYRHIGRHLMNRNVRKIRER